METNPNYAVVGAFILTLITATVLAVIWLSSGFKLKTNTNYLISMSESVAGLSVDSPVEYNGVNVGSVKQITIDPNNPQHVKVIVSIQSTVPITRGTVATLNTRGVTGMTYVALKDAGHDLRPLRPEKGHRYAVIQTAPSLFTRLDTVINQLSKSLLDMARTFNQVFDTENQKAFKQTLLNLQEVTNNLAKNNQQLTNLINNTANASKKLNPLINTTKSTVQTLETQTLPATYKILQNLNSVSKNLEDISLQMRENPSILIRGSTPAKLGPGEH